MVIREGRHNRRNLAAEKFMQREPASLADQATALRVIFPTSKIVLSKDRLEWMGTLQPSPYSCEYTVKIEYDLYGSPKASVIFPELSRRNEHPDTPIPHMFEQKYLCLYYPKAGEWRRIDWLHRSIIPWISCWLYYYELWHVTGNWLGGGIVHQNLELSDMDDSPKKGKGRI